MATWIKVSEFEYWCVQNKIPADGETLCSWIEKYPMDYHSWFLAEEKMAVDDAAKDEREGAVESLLRQFKRLLGRDVINTLA